MRRYLFYILLLILFILFQSTSLYSRVSIKEAHPDFILTVLALAAFFLGPIPGEILGFATGLVLDILSGRLLGLFAFTFTLIGYGVGVMGQKVYLNSGLISIILLFVVTLIKAAVVTLMAALFLGPGYFGYFSGGRIFLEAVMNSLVVLPFFFFALKMERKVVG